MEYDVLSDVNGDEMVVWVVHVDYEKQRLVTINLDNDVVVHVDYPVEHRLAGHDSPRRGRIVVHLDYVK